MTDELQIRIQNGDGPTLIYLPGTHGDWTLNGSFRREMKGYARLVEFTFPRTIEWSLTDYANAIEKKLIENKVERGWILAESFASQVAWAWAGQNPKKFHIEGIILAGGFVRHPIIPAVRLAKFLTLNIPGPVLKSILKLYLVYAGLREKPDSDQQLQEFVKRRTKDDLLGAAHRLQLIAENDLRPIARATELPVLYLTGLIDPIVPWPFVHRWLKRHCPGFRGWKMVRAADHHVLGAARESAQIIRGWMQGGSNHDFAQKNVHEAKIS
jgi:pimeloyl-ACP methyl ester carboxylesterase